MSISARARRSLMVLVALAAMGGTIFAQRGTSRALDLFEQALAKERAEGDLRSAIALYERVVAEAGGDRTIAGSALFHMADCYTKLGSPEARKILDRIIVDFADQPGLVARARAARTTPSVPAPPPPPGLVERPAGPGARLIESPAGRPSPDARWIAVRTQSPDGPRLAIMDQATKQLHDVVRSGAEGDLCGESVWSRDSTRLVYPWCPRGGSGAVPSNELRIATVIGGAARVLVATSPALLQPLDWSADGQSILAWSDASNGQSDLALVGVASGSVRLLGARGVLRPLPTAAALSPDGRFAVLTPDASDRGILVVDVGTGSVQPLVTPVNHDTFLGWHPDGRHLLLVSDRFGTFDVWSAQFSDGVLQGAPTPIAADIGPITPLGLTAAGALYYSGAVGQPHAVTDLFLASLDPANGRVSAPAERLTRPGGGHLIFPVWSADSRQLAYKIGASGGSTTGAIAILTLATGQERQVRPRVTGTLGQFDWSRDGRQFVGAYTQGDRQALYLIDSETGEASLVMSGTATADPSGSPGRGNVSQPRWMPDGRSIAAVMDARIVVRRLDNGEERTAVSVNAQITSFGVSPDGGSFAFVAGGNIMVAGVNGGPPRNVAPLPLGASAKLVAWSPDSQFLIFANRTAAATVPGATTPYAELWRVPIAGGLQERLNLAADSIIQPAISPDGRWIAFSVNTDLSPNVHVLELVRRK